MGNVWLTRNLRIGFFSAFFIIHMLVLLVSLLSGAIQFAFICLLFSIPFAYLGFGIDMQRKKKATQVLEEKMRSINQVESIQCIADGYHEQKGRGHLALTDHFLFFITRKKEIYSIDLLTVERYGTRADGTGVYGTTIHHSGPISIASTQEAKIPMFYVEGIHAGEHFHYAFSTFKNTKFFKILDRNLSSGKIAKESAAKNQEQQKQQQVFENENAVLIQNMNRIMDTEINDLDTPLYLQNGKAYLEIYFDIFKEQFPNLNALQEGEKHTFFSYLQACMLRGSRMYSTIVEMNHGKVLSLQETPTLPIDLLEENFPKTFMPNYPAVKQIVYSQFRGFRYQNQTMITEEQALSLTEEYIKIGFRNAMSNFLAYNELQNRVTV
ncbi:hypothetical protein [Bacillus cereus]|uniref:Uncharacterized protein n=1 Tax=Bacillus cereus TaxID=1396 RepID=A0A2C1LX49_BACCE|nr:hypothetical protein [Bacillus cereus]PGU02231.1 hypothetical protein COD19_12345 [Bacillus cereus]